MLNLHYELTIPLTNKALQILDLGLQNHSHRLALD